MSNLRYAVVEFYTIGNCLASNTIKEDFSDIKEAEKFRTKFLSLAPIEYTLLDPQMLQVVQYVV